jgi:hypothetical protein
MVTFEQQRVVRSSRVASAPVRVRSQISSSLIQRKAGHCACGGSCPRCQAKSNLTISQPNDPAEREADAMADHVMRMSVEDVEPRGNERTPSGRILRQCDACEDEEETIQRKYLPSDSSISPQSPAHVREAIGTSGQSLNRETRSFFEPRLGYELSHVRIHMDGQAAESARALNARAYTLGNDIVFGSEEYNPTSESGKHLLAHELVHVTQQGRDGHQQLKRKPATSENVWGFNVTRSMCGCLPRVRDGIDWANTAGSTYAGCDVPANATATAVEACFDAAIPGTSVAGSTSASGSMTLPPPSADPCQRIEDRATFVHETMHSRHTDTIARARGTAFFREWRRLEGDPDRINTLRATFPAEVAAFEAQWNDGHDWAQDEVNSYRWERRFLEDVRRALNRICS